MKTRLSLATESAILKLSDLGQTQTLIAQTLGVSQGSVSVVLKELADSRPLARRVIDAAAHKLARRVVEHADVDQSLEILDRISVIEKRQQVTGHANIAVVIGMPGQPAGIDPLQVIDIKALRDECV